MEREEGSKKRKLRRNEENSVVFKRRKEGIIKKARELSILCDIPVCVLIQAPSGDFDIWPQNVDQTRSIVDKYKQTEAKIASNPSKISTRKVSPKAGEMIPDEATAAANYNQEYSESQSKIVSQSPEEAGMILKSCNNRCNRSEVEFINEKVSLFNGKQYSSQTEQENVTKRSDDYDLVNQFFGEEFSVENPGESLCSGNRGIFATGLSCLNGRVSLYPGKQSSQTQKVNGTKRTTHNDLVNQPCGEKGFAGNPGESLCSENHEIFATGLSCLNEGKRSLENGGDQGNAKDDSCSFSEVDDLQPTQVLDPDFEPGGSSSFNNSTDIDGFSAMGDPSWPHFLDPEYSNWESLWSFEESALCF